jgi:tetratricopeptide (TPR) repeat protein
MVKNIHFYALILLFLFYNSDSFAAELSNDEIQKAYYSSYALEKSQDYLGAIRALKPVFTTYPKGYTVNFRTGWLYYLNGNFADALNYYKAALTIYPASVEVMNSISLVYKARLEWSKVETQNFAVIKIDYFNQTANYWYAYALIMQKKYDIAEKVCRKMLTVFPTSVLFLNELGELLYYKNDITQALEMFNSSLILQPDDAYATKFVNLILKK